MLKLQVPPSLFSSLRDRLSSREVDYINFYSDHLPLSCVKRNRNKKTTEYWSQWEVIRVEVDVVNFPAAQPVSLRRKQRGRHLQLQHTTQLLIYADPLPLGYYGKLGKMVEKFGNKISSTGCKW